MIQCRIELEYGDPATALAVHRATTPDNAAFVKSDVSGTRVVAVLDAASPLKLLHTVDDYLACVAIAEKAVEVARR